MSKLETNTVDSISGTSTLTLGGSNASVVSAGTEVRSNKLSPASGTALQIGDSGDTITIPSGATIVNSGTQTGFGGVNTPAFLAKPSSDQTSLSNNSDIKVLLGTEVFDVGSCFASSRFTVPSGEAGKYFLYGSVSGLTGANSDLDQSFSSFYLNGSQYMEGGINLNDNPIRFATNLIHVVLDLSVGNYVELYGKVDHVGASSIKFDSSNKCTNFGGYKIIT